MLSPLTLLARPAVLVVAALISAPFAAGAMADEASPRIRIEELDTAATSGPPPAAAAATPSSLTLFDATTNRLRGWSHLAAAPRELPTPRFAAPDYAIHGDDEGGGNVREMVPGGGRAFHAVLVKRLADWDRNHLNGIEPLFADAPLAVGAIEAIVLEVRFDSARSTLPSAAELARRFGKWLTAEQLASLDNDCAHLGVSVFEAEFNEHDRSILNAATIVEFDPARHFDRWLRVTIPVEALEFFFEKNYARTPTDRGAQLARELVGLRINPESRSGRTVRHLLRDGFTPEIPECLKEMAFAIRRLEIRRRA